MVYSLPLNFLDFLLDLTKNNNNIVYDSVANTFGSLYYLCLPLNEISGLMGSSYICCNPLNVPSVSWLFFPQGFYKLLQIRELSYQEPGKVGINTVGHNSGTDRFTGQDMEKGPGASKLSPGPCPRISKCSPT